MKKKRTMLRFPRGSMAKILLRMKLLTVLMLAVFAVSAANSYSQATKFSLRLNDATVREVFQQIEENSEFILLYNEKLVDVDRRVSVDVKNETVESVLNQVFEGTTNAYRIYDRQIVILQDENAEVPSILKGKITDAETSLPQEKEISGKVTDTQGLPLPGVSVVVKGTTLGTVTNADGEFSLSIPVDAEILQFSFVGMRTQEVVVGNQTSINVTMVVDAIGIEEVVAIGYGTVKRSDLTGSVASVKSEELKNTPITNISQTLQGRVAGVNVRQSQTSPGGDITVRVRGISTFMGETKPLYVIDGIIGGDINTINPTDIESIEILKDASSTSIYGANGANGVILITTKSGKEGKNRIHFDGHFGVQQVTRTLDLLNAKEWAEIDNYRNELLGYEYRWDLNNLPGNTDWQKELYQITPIVNLNLSSSGGNASLNYFTSLDYINQSGILENTGYERANFRLNLDADINERIKIGSRIGAMRSNRNKMMEEGNYSERSSVLETALMPPILNPYDESGNLLPNLSWTGSDGTPITVSNPLHFQKNLVDKAKRTGISGSIFTKIELIKGLTFRPSFNFNFHSEENGYYKSSKMYDVSDEFRNSASLGYLDNTRINSDILIDYAKTFNNHEISLLGGFIVTSSRLESISASVDDFALDNFLYHSLNSGETWRAINSNLVEKKGIGYISRVNYNFKQKYYLSYSMRYDGSSVMGRNNKWGFFPSGAVMWKLSEEDFLKNSELMQDAKFRVSYGISGSDALGAYASHSRMTGSLSNGYIVDGVPLIGYKISSLEVPDLKWEETAMLDVGFEMAILKGRLGLELEYYHKNTTDLFLSVPVPRTSGVGEVTKNTGSIVNSGYEVMIKAIPISKYHFNYKTNFNISFQKQEVTDIGNVEEIILSVAKMGPAENVFQVKVGQPLGSFYGLQEDGIWQMNENYGKQFGQTAKAGDRKFVDQNNDGDITSDDRVIIGNALPKFFGGWTNVFSYKKLDINVLFDFLSGNDIYNAAKYRTLSNLTHGNNKIKDYKDYWTPDNPDAKLPALNGYDTSNAALTEYMLEDGSYFRLRELTLGYTISSQKVSRIRLFCNVTNVFTLTKYSGSNPDVDVSNSNTVYNVEHGGYPYYRTFTLGTNITF